MPKVDLKYYHQLVKSQTLAELIPLLQKAVELEHTIMIAYLVPLFSIKPQKQLYAAKTLTHISKEEMLHMSIVANIINAFGGKPVLNKPSFVKEYPTKLPLGVDNDLVVNLTKYDLDAVKNTFMVIEEPYHELNFDTQKHDPIPSEFTQGEFYRALIKKIEEIAPHKLPGNPDLQVTSTRYPASELFPIQTKDDALRALNIVLEQGEGSAKSPKDDIDELSHYYRFEELYRQKKLVADSSNKLGYSFTGASIPYDANDVYNIYPNTKMHMFAKHEAAYAMLYNLNMVYTTMLNRLNTVFNGNPNGIEATIGQMHDIASIGKEVCALPFPGKSGYHVGPSFEFMKV